MITERITTLHNTQTLTIRCDHAGCTHTATHQVYGQYTSYCEQHIDANTPHGTRWITSTTQPNYWSTR